MGSFITLYGINNIGKTTQARLLVERLRREGYDAVSLKYPVYDLAPTGPFLDQVLRSGEASQKISEEQLQMWFTLNRYQFQPTLEKWLSEGKIVIAEDYVGTGIAWGTAKGASMEWLQNLNHGLRKEDLSILLTGKRFIKAREDGHLHESDDELVMKTGEVFLQLAREYQWQVLEVAPKREVTSEMIYGLVKQFLTGSQSS